MQTLEGIFIQKKVGLVGSDNTACPIILKMEEVG
jgi:hypothetical protein